MAVERTISIIKPDAVAKNAIGDIISRFEKADLKVAAAKMMTMSQEQQDKLRSDIETMQQSYQAKAQPLQENIRRRQAEERNKIMAIIKTAVDEVAAEKKIDVVFQAQSVAFVTPEKDISQLVIEKASKVK